MEPTLLLSEMKDLSFIDMMLNQSLLVLQALGSSLLGQADSSNSSGVNVKMLVELADEVLKQKNVESVLFGGKRIAEQTNFEKLDWFAGELVLEHQRRSFRIAPTVAFKQATTQDRAKERS